MILSCCYINLSSHHLKRAPWKPGWPFLNGFGKMLRIKRYSRSNLLEDDMIFLAHNIIKNSNEERWRHSKWRIRGNFLIIRLFSQNSASFFVAWVRKNVLYPYGLSCNVVLFDVVRKLRVWMGGSKCRLSVKISLLCRLSVKIFDLCRLSVNLS